MSEVYHELIHFSGHVQGVGFRYSVHQVAKEFEVTGYVKNLPDGRVELVAQGRAPEVKAFVEAVSQAQHGFIRKVDRSVIQAAELLSGFLIR